MKNKSLLFTALATLGLTAATMAQNVPNYVPSNGLVGWWPFNGNANDESGNGNNGTVNGATLTSDRFGQVNKSYVFNGTNNFVNIGNNVTYNSHSFSCWAKRDSLNGNVLVSKVNNGPFDVKNSEFTINGFTIGDGTTWLTLNVTNNFNPQIWNHYAITYESNNNVAKYYINGILTNSMLLGNYIDVVNSPIYFGARPFWGGVNGPSFFFGGKLDDIGIWNRALTQQEITDLYNANICYQSITVTDTLLINMGITGYNPVSYNNTIKIFPNPTNDHITINYGNFASLSGYQLKIQNSLGQQVFQTNITQQTDYLALATWGGNGLYFVHIIDAQGNTIDIRKIVLQ